MTNICLVTGANGHLGNNLVRALLDKGEKVRASVRSVNYLEPFEGLDCEVVYADLLDRESLSKATKDVDTLYQVAAVYKIWAKNPEENFVMVLAFLMELFSKITGKPPNMTRSIVKTYCGADQSCNISKARRELGYNPRSPEEILKESLIYLAEREGL